MKKFSFRVLAAALVVAVMLSVFALTFGTAADVKSAGEGTTDYSMTNPDTQYTPISSSPTTSPRGGDYYSAAADMNRDMVLNSADARFILRLAARIEWVRHPRYLPAGTVFGDIDENGKVNAADARWTLRVAAKLNTVSEVIAQTMNKPVPTKPTDPTSPSTPGSSVAPTTTAAPTTTENPLELKMPICEEFVVKMKTTGGSSYIVASDGVNCYIKTDDMLKGFAVFVDRSGNIFVISDAEKEYTEFGAEFSRKLLGITAESVRDFIKRYAVPEFDVFDGCKVSQEIIKDIPMTIAEKNGSKFYFYADGELAKIVAKDLSGKTTDMTVSEYSDDASSYTSLPAKYTAKNSSEFIIFHGLDLIMNKF